MKKFLNEEDLDTVGLYASPGCKKCYGRGYMLGQVPMSNSFRKDEPVLQYAIVCSCVNRNKKKYDIAVG